MKHPVRPPTPPRGPQPWRGVVRSWTLPVALIVFELTSTGAGAATAPPRTFNRALLAARPELRSVAASTGVVSGARARLPLVVKPGETLTVDVRRDGAFVHAPAALTNIAGTTYLDVPTGAVFYLRPAQIPAARPAAHTNLVLLPGELAMILADGRKVGGKVYLRQDQTMGYDPLANEYRGLVQVGWLSTNTPDELRGFPQIHVRLGTDLLRPSTNHVVIAAPATAGEVSVQVTARRCYQDQAVTARYTDQQTGSLPETSLLIRVHCPGFADFISLFMPLPVWFALALGSVLGATARYLVATRSRRRDRSQSRLKPFLLYTRHLVEGLTTALGSYLLLQAGFTFSGAIPPAVLQTLVGAAAWGVIAGYVGAALFERFVWKS